MLKGLDRDGVFWLPRLCQVAWCSGRAQQNWQIEMFFGINKREDLGQYIKVHGDFSLYLPG